MRRYFWRRRLLFYYVQNRKNLRLVRVLLTIVLFCFLAVYTDARYFRPVIKKLAESKAQLIATRILNNAISDTISKNGAEYDKLLIIDKNDDGSVAAIRTNMKEINTIKTAVMKDVLDALSDIDDAELNIPIGSLFNWEFLMGRGPSLPIRIQPAVGAAETNFISIFSSAGINQTKHRIVLECKATICVIMPGGSVTTQIKTDVNVAETVIVGKAPDSYTYIDDTRESDTLSKFNDYSNK
ncbi:MAG: sporulation protein YunB [Bacillota bacterium]|nr:sporulation protein YunB [Bacillota bacterium]